MRRPRVGDGADPRVSLSYELHRTLLSSETDGSQTLRELLGQSQDEVAAFDNETCVRLVDKVVQELFYLMSLPEVGDTLRHRLAHVTGPEARDLVTVWRQMPCRNASLIEFSPVMTRLLNCNTAPLLLGAGQSAKGAGLYMCKYMIKDPPHQTFNTVFHRGGVPLPLFPSARLSVMMRS